MKQQPEDVRIFLVAIDTNTHATVTPNTIYQKFTDFEGVKVFDKNEVVSWYSTLGDSQNLTADAPAPEVVAQAIRTKLRTLGVPEESEHSESEDGGEESQTEEDTHSHSEDDEGAAGSPPSPTELKFFVFLKGFPLTVEHCRALEQAGCPLHCILEVNSQVPLLQPQQEEKVEDPKSKGKGKKDDKSKDKSKTGKDGTQQKKEDPKKGKEVGKKGKKEAEEEVENLPQLSLTTQVQNVAQATANNNGQDNIRDITVVTYDMKCEEEEPEDESAPPTLLLIDTEDDAVEFLAEKIDELEKSRFEYVKWQENRTVQPVPTLAEFHERERLRQKLEKKQNELTALEQVQLLDIQKDQNKDKKGAKRPPSGGDPKAANKKKDKATLEREREQEREREIYQNLLDEITALENQLKYMPELTPANIKVNRSYYNKLCSILPNESCTVPLMLHCMMEQATRNVECAKSINNNDVVPTTDDNTSSNGTVSGNHNNNNITANNVNGDHQSRPSTQGSLPSSSLPRNSQGPSPVSGEPSGTTVQQQQHQHVSGADKRDSTGKPVVNEKSSQREVIKLATYDDNSATEELVDCAVAISDYFDVACKALRGEPTPTNAQQCKAMKRDTATPKTKNEQAEGINNNNTSDNDSLKDTKLNNKSQYSSEEGIQIVPHGDNITLRSTLLPNKKPLINGRTLEDIEREMLGKQQLIPSIEEGHIRWERMEQEEPLQQPHDGKSSEPNSKQDEQGATAAAEGRQEAELEEDVNVTKVLTPAQIDRELQLFELEHLFDRRKQLLAPPLVLGPGPDPPDPPPYNAPVDFEERIFYEFLDKYTLSQRISNLFLLEQPIVVNKWMERLEGTGLLVLYHDVPPERYKWTKVHRSFSGRVYFPEWLSWKEEVAAAEQALWALKNKPKKPIVDPNTAQSEEGEPTDVNNNNEAPPTGSLPPMTLEDELAALQAAEAEEEQQEEEAEDEAAKAEAEAAARAEAEAVANETQIEKNKREMEKRRVEARLLQLKQKLANFDGAEHCLIGSRNHFVTELSEETTTLYPCDGSVVTVTLSTNNTHNIRCSVLKDDVLIGFRTPVIAPELKEKPTVHNRIGYPWNSTKDSVLYLSSSFSDQSTLCVYTKLVFPEPSSHIFNQLEVATKEYTDKLAEIHAAEEKAEAERLANEANVKNKDKREQDKDHHQDNNKPRSAPTPPPKLEELDGPAPSLMTVVEYGCYNGLMVTQQCNGDIFMTYNAPSTHLPVNKMDIELRIGPNGDINDSQQIKQMQKEKEERERKLALEKEKEANELLQPDDPKDKRAPSRGRTPPPGTKRGKSPTSSREKGAVEKGDNNSRRSEDKSNEPVTSSVAQENEGNGNNTKPTDKPLLFTHKPNVINPANNCVANSSIRLESHLDTIRFGRPEVISVFDPITRKVMQLLVQEVNRKICGKGSVIRYFVDGSIQVLLACGNTSTCYKGFWMVTNNKGKRSVTINAQGECVEMEGLLCARNLDPETRAVVTTRDDLVMIVDYFDNTRLVQHADGTRIWSNDTGNKIRIEHERYATIELVLPTTLPQPGHPTTEPSNSNEGQGQREGTDCCTTTTQIELPDTSILRYIQGQEFALLRKDGNYIRCDIPETTLSFEPASLLSCESGNNTATTQGVYYFNYLRGGMYTADYENNRFLVTTVGKTFVKLYDPLAENINDDDYEYEDVDEDIERLMQVPLGTLRQITTVQDVNTRPTKCKNARIRPPALPIKQVKKAKHHSLHQLLPMDKTVPNESTIQVNQPKDKFDYTTPHTNSSPYCSFNSHTPKLFLVNTDGSGTELLSALDVLPYIKHATTDLKNTTIQHDTVNGQPHLSTVTVTTKVGNSGSKSLALLHKLIPKAVDNVHQYRIVTNNGGASCCGTNSVHTNNVAFYQSDQAFLSYVNAIHQKARLTDTSEHQQPKEASNEGPPVFVMRQLLKYEPVTDKYRNALQQALRDQLKAGKMKELYSQSLQIVDDRSSIDIEDAESIKQALLHIQSKKEQELRETQLQRQKELEASRLAQASTAVLSEADEVLLNTVKSVANEVGTILASSGSPEAEEQSEEPEKHKMMRKYYPDPINSKKDLASSMEESKPVYWSTPDGTDALGTLMEKPGDKPRKEEDRKALEDRVSESKRVYASQMAEIRDQQKKAAPVEQQLQQSQQSNNEEGRDNGEQPPSEQQGNESQVVAQAELEALLDAQQQFNASNASNTSSKLCGWHVDVYGKPRKGSLKIPGSSRSKTMGVDNEKYIPRKANSTANKSLNSSITPQLAPLDKTETPRLVASPDHLNFGIVPEGMVYCMDLTLTNIGKRACRFNFKQIQSKSHDNINELITFEFKKGPIAPGLALSVKVIVIGLSVNSIEEEVVVHGEANTLTIPISISVRPGSEGGQVSVKKGVKVLGNCKLPSLNH